MSNVYELYHHGVKGMKWGHRRAVTRKYKKLGRQMGREDYYREQSKKVGDEYDRRAAELDAKAAIYKSEGNAVKAAKLSAKAQQVRNEKNSATAETDALAEKYRLKQSVMQAKIHSAETKKNVNLGQAKVDHLLLKTRNKERNKMVRSDQVSKALGMMVFADAVNDSVTQARRDYNRRQQERARTRTNS